MSYRETEHLRVLIANERKDRLALVAPIVAALGHEVIAREIEVADVGALSARERPDVGNREQRKSHAMLPVTAEGVASPPYAPAGGQRNFQPCSRPGSPRRAWRAPSWEAPGWGMRDDGAPGSLRSMPFAETGPVKLYYESRGRGPAVLQGSSRP